MSYSYCLLIIIKNNNITAKYCIINIPVIKYSLVCQIKSKYSIFTSFTYISRNIIKKDIKLMNVILLIYLNKQYLNTIFFHLMKVPTHLDMQGMKELKV